MLELRVPPRLFSSRLPTLRLWSPCLLPSGVRTLRLCACEFWWRFRSRHRRRLPPRRRAPLDAPMSDIPRVVFPDYKRKLPVAMTQKGKRPSTGAHGFFGTHELPGADCPFQKTAPRRPSGYVTTIGTEPQVAPFRAAIPPWGFLKADRLLRVAPCQVTVCRFAGTSSTPSACERGSLRFERTGAARKGPGTTQTRSNPSPPARSL